MTFYLYPHMHRRHMHPRRSPSARMAEQDFEHRLAANVRDEEDAFILTSLVPGLKAEDLTINILEDVVTIEGEIKPDENEYLLRELPSGKFRRSLRLPAPVNADKAEAKIADGILTLRLPKAESARPKKIKISAK